MLNVDARPAVAPWNFLGLSPARKLYRDLDHTQSHHLLAAMVLDLPLKRVPSWTRRSDERGADRRSHMVAVTQVFIFHSFKSQNSGADLTNAMIWRCVTWFGLSHLRPHNLG